MPRVALHPKTYGSLPAVDGKLTEYRDDVVPGLVLRVLPSGVRTFVVSYWRHGRGQRYKLGNAPALNLGAARAAARKLLPRIQLGEDPAAARRSERAGAPLSVADLARRCVAALELRPTTRKGYTWLLEKRIVPQLGSRLAHQLSRGEVRAWAEGLAKETPYAANRALEVLKRAYSWAVQRELLEHNPCTGVQAPGTEKARDRILSADELAALARVLHAQPGQVADVVWLLLFTGARLNMVVSARFEELEDLDGKEPRWAIPAARMKAAEPHVVPLVPAALAVVRRRLENGGGDPWLFPAISDPAKPMYWASRHAEKIATAVAKELGKEVPTWTMHGLRHTIATHMVEDLGVATDVVSMILSHTPLVAATTRVYMRATLMPQRRKALLALSEWIARLNDRGRARVLQHGRRRS